MPFVQQAQNKYEITPKGECPAFSKIEISGITNVYLAKGVKHNISVDSEQDIQMVEFKIIDGTLSLSATPMVSTKLNIYVTFVDLSTVKMSGQSTLTCLDEIISNDFKFDATGATESDLILKAVNVKISCSGATSLKIEGSAENFILKASGASDIMAGKFLVHNAKIFASGASSVKVNATESITGELSGASSLKYVAKPPVYDIKITGISSDIADTLIGDTVRIKIGKKIIIFDEDKKKDVKRTNKESKFDGHWSGLELGINSFLNEDLTLDLPAQYSFLDLKLQKSIEVNLNIFEQDLNLIRNKLGLVTGLGISFNNYRFANNVILVSDTVPLFGYHDIKGGINYEKSKLATTFLTLPLILEFQTKGAKKGKLDDFHVSFGPIVGLKLASHSKVVYTQNDNTEKNKVKDDFNLEPFRYGLTGRIGWGYLNLYANYTLSDMFKKNQGPEVNPFSVGIVLTGF